MLNEPDFVGRRAIINIGTFMLGEFGDDDKNACVIGSIFKGGNQFSFCHRS